MTATTHEIRTKGRDDVIDITEAVRRLFPESLRYAHHEAAGDENGFSHLRAAFIGPSLSIPFTGGTLQLGT